MADVATAFRHWRCFFLLVLLLPMLFGSASGGALVGDSCKASSPGTSSDVCGKGLRCTSCVPPPGTGPSSCARTSPIDPKTHGTALPFNRYAWLTTHNSFAVVGTRSPLGSAIIAPPNQEDTVTAQLRNGVRGLMLDAYDFNGAVWFCHSFQGRCLPFTAYVPAQSLLTEIRVFLDGNPAEVVTVFLEDYAGPGSLSKAFSAAGLTKYWYPEAKMPRNGSENWPALREMIAENHRLVVFTSKKGKQATEGLAHLWDYVVETQYGNEGMGGGCPKRSESRPMDSKTQSLVLLNFFTSNPSQSWACGNNSAPLIGRLNECYKAAGNRWPNYIAVDFYMRSNGGGAPLATDVANGRLQCGRENIAQCKPSSAHAPSPSPEDSSSPSPAPALAPELASSAPSRSAPAPDFASPSISLPPGPAPGPAYI